MLIVISPVPSKKRSFAIMVSFKLLKSFLFDDDDDDHIWTVVFLKNVRPRWILISETSQILSVENISLWPLKKRIIRIDISWLKL